MRFFWKPAPRANSLRHEIAVMKEALLLAQAEGDVNHARRIGVRLEDFVQADRMLRAADNVEGNRS